MASFWEHSTTYQAILREGQLLEARDCLLRQGRRLFGPADEATESAINGIEDLEKLEALIMRILDVSSWQELLQPSPRQRRGGSKRKKT